MPARSDFLSLVAGTTGLVDGWAEPVYLPDPAAGAQFASYVIDGSVWIRLAMAAATFTADATVGNRTPRLEIVDVNGKVLYAVPVATAVVASGVLTAKVALHGPVLLAASGLSVVSFTPVVLQSGYTVRFAHDAVGPADSWSKVTFYVEKYPSDAARAQIGA